MHIKRGLVIILYFIVCQLTSITSYFPLPISNPIAPIHLKTNQTSFSIALIDSHNSHPLHNLTLNTPYDHWKFKPLLPPLSINHYFSRKPLLAPPHCKPLLAPPHCKPLLAPPTANRYSPRPLQTTTCPVHCKPLLAPPTANHYLPRPLQTTTRPAHCKPLLAPSTANHYLPRPLQTTTCPAHCKLLLAPPTANYYLPRQLQTTTCPAHCKPLSLEN